jgi:leucyl aminopeptidase (aminopeptidase T)
MEDSIDLEKLIIDVFAPEPGEKVLAMTDLPQGDIADNDEWSARRQMAHEWQEVFQRLGRKIGFTVHPLLTYLATGSSNADLPEEGEMAGRSVRLDQAMANSDIVVALTEYSATAPLIRTFLQEYRDLRAASMPGVSKAMEKTALAADYREVARKGQILADRLNRAVGARVRFSTGHGVHFDLRHRKAGVDDGQLHRDKVGIRLINLPSGEAFKAPYEGEIEGDPSRTEGTIPVVLEDEMTLFKIRENRIVEIVGEGRHAASQREYFGVDPARRNVAELGLGTNDKAIIRGNVLEDEKVLGLHWAYGRSDHIGGSVGVNSFSDPRHVVHKDIVYAEGTRVGIASLVLVYEDGTEEEIIRDNTYAIF